MTEAESMTLANAPVPVRGRHWTSKAGAWFGVGASPGGLLLGATIAARHGGPAPILSVIIGVVLMAMLLWFQGLIGLAPPVGEGGNFTEIIPRYFDSLMQRVLGGVLALAMIGWFGFNVGLGGAALSALLDLPPWVGPLLLGLPILGLSLRGLKQWNGLAILTTAAALILVILVVVQLSARIVPFTFALGEPANMFADVAVFVGYASVFSVRAPDFSAGLATRKDLAVSVALFCTPVVAVAFAGVGLQQGTGSADLVGILARPGGLAIGNLLVATAVIAPIFTTLYSGAPAVRAATGLGVGPAMIGVAVLGLGLAIARFDLWLGPWLTILAAILPSLVVPMAVEAIRRRRGYRPRLVPLWTWSPGSLAAVILIMAHYTFAPLVGLGIAVVGTGMWCCIFRR